jgi:hypothetical protein
VVGSYESGDEPSGTGAKVLITIAKIILCSITLTFVISLII